MKTTIKYLLLGCAILAGSHTNAQTYNTAYARALHKKYPSVKSDFCKSCKLWTNPFYKSIADTEKHMPLITYYIYTKAHRLKQEAAKVPRKGVYSSWFSAYGQPDETKVYKQSNVESSDIIAKGHCQAWILLAWCEDGAILSDTYTFNAGMEYQGQNIGTEIETEELCRQLTGYEVPETTDSVHIWCGTWGAQHTFTKDDVTVTMPSHYYKIIKYIDINSGEPEMLCYWMPNLPTEKRALVKDRMVTYEVLVHNLGYDPMKVLND